MHLGLDSPPGKFSLQANAACALIALPTVQIAPHVGIAAVHAEV